MGDEQRLDGAVVLTHALKYYSRSELPALSSTPETAHALYYASHMMWGEFAYSAIDLQTYG
jgi:hypothetical protein